MTRSTALSSRATTLAMSLVEPSVFLRSFRQPLMSLALTTPATGGFWKPPWCSSTTMASMPWARSRGTSALTVSASSLKVRPATPVGVTTPGVPLNVMPIKATLTPPKLLMP